MIRILHTADWHLGKRLQEYSRISEQKEVLDEIVEVADTKKVDLVLIAGDIFDSFNPSHESVELFFKTIKRLSLGGERPVVIISGNHDSTQFIEAPDPLAREMGILFYGKYDSLIPKGEIGNGIQVCQSEKGFVELQLPGLDFPVRIILAPYANELLLKAYLGEEDREAELRNILAHRWQDLANTYCDSNGVNLFLGHFFFIKEGKVPDPEPESERPILHVGGTQALFTHDLPESIQYAALGHLHRYHSVQDLPFPVTYSSSPLAYSFSEADQEKQVVIIEAKPSLPVTVSPLALKKGKPLHRKTFDNLPQTLEWLQNHQESYVELTYITENAIDASTRKAIQNAHDGIVNLIPQIKNPLGLSGAGLQVADLEKDMKTLFSMYYEASRGLAPNEEILSIFTEIISQNEHS
jgi:DNA repair protein SbcD/Mre11